MLHAFLPDRQFARVPLAAAGDPRLRARLTTACLMAATTALYAIEQRLLTQPTLPILRLSWIPLLTGISLLNLRQQTVLAALLLVLVVCSSPLSHGFAGPEAFSLLGADVALIALCLLTCRQKCLLQQRTRQLALALQASLKSAAVVHELKQPLALLPLQCRLLLSMQEQSGARLDQAEQINGLHALLASAENLNATVQALSTLLRSTIGSAAQPLDLVAVVNNSLLKIKPQLLGLGITLQICGLEQPLWLRGDAAQLGILCDNLLRNACEAITAAKREQRKLCISLRRSAGTIELCIADSGPGLRQCNPEALLLTSSKADGLGLGLYTAALIAQHHNGQIDIVKSESLGGAELRLTLPMPAAGMRAWRLANSDAAQPAAPIQNR